MTTQQGTTGAEFPATFVPLVDGSTPLRRFTVDEYHRMIETGILGTHDHVELIDGWIVEMSPIGPPHTTCVSLVHAALQECRLVGWTVRVQSPVTMITSEPEPDVAVVRGGIRDYGDHHPAGPEIALVIEVADTSLQFDRQQKRSQYAMAGIAEYWIVNLADRCLEVHRDPAGGGEYRAREVIGADGSVELTIDGKNVGRLAVADLLP
jgi:Uma2 family endonuclease